MGELPAMHSPLRAVPPPRGVQGEEKRLITGEGLGRESHCQTSRSRMSRPPPRSLSLGPPRPESALSKRTMLPGSKSTRNTPQNTKGHPTTEALLHPRTQCPLRSRVAGRRGCEPGAARALRFSSASARRSADPGPQDGECGQGTELTPNVPLQPESSKKGPPAPPSPATGFLEDSQSLPFGASFVAGHCSLEEQPL